MGITGETAWPRRADLAIIRLRAKAPTRATSLEFVTPNDYEKGSGITFIGRDVVGDPDDNTDGFQSVSFSIR
jgi:hypothetical protein